MILSAKTILLKVDELVKVTNGGDFATKAFNFLLDKVQFDTLTWKARRITLRSGDTELVMTIAKREYNNNIEFGVAKYLFECSIVPISDVHVFGSGDFVEFRFAYAENASAAHQHLLHLIKEEKNNE